MDIKRVYGVKNRRLVKTSDYEAEEKRQRQGPRGRGGICTWERGKVRGFEGEMHRGEGKVRGYAQGGVSDDGRTEIKERAIWNQGRQKS